MNKYIKAYKLLRLYNEEIENLNKSITRKENESVIKNLPRNKSLGPGGFTDKIYKILFKN